MNQITHAQKSFISASPIHEPIKIGHSYLRWSSSEQSKGDSLQRQIAARDRICQQRGITLRQNYTDPGMSARRGKHRIKGNLARLLKAIGTTIKPGEYLLIENIDRLSRENPRQAWKQFNEIIDAGITIITTYNDREYSAKTIDGNTWQMHELLGEMQRAYSESDVKSQRIGGAWERNRQKAATGKKISAKAPAWLTAARNDQGEVTHFEPVPERVKVVNDIFELASNKMGAWSIAKVLNGRKVPTFSGIDTKWRSTIIGKIVSSPAVLGTYVPKKRVDGRWEACDPIDGYYGKPIVDPAVFARANALREGLDQTGAARKRRGKAVVNIFSERCFCDDCGGTMRYKSYAGKVSKQGVKGRSRKYLFCENNMLGNGCGYTRKANYDWTEETILNHINVFPLEELFTDHSGTEEFMTIEAKIAAVMVKLDKLERDAAKAKRFMMDAETVEEEREWRRDLNATLQATKPVQAELAAIRRKKSDLEITLNSQHDARNMLAQLKAEMAAADEGSRYLVRQKLSVLLNTYIDQIRFHEDFITVILHGGLINFRFSLSKRGGASKKNPMKLIGARDLRVRVGDPAKGLIPPEAFGGTQDVFDKLMAQSNSLVRHSR